MKLNLIKLINNNNNNKLNNNIIIIELLKNILLNNNIIKNNTNNNNNNNNQLNNLNNNHWQTMIYMYNKNIEKDILIIDNLTSKLLIKVMNIKDNKLFISKPIFKHNINTVIIRYYYYNINNNNNNNIYINNIINLINIILKLSNILSYYYNKKVIIEPIKLSYVYLNNDIFTNYISYLITGNYNNNKLNIETIINEYLNIFNNIIPLNINNNSTDNKLIYKYLLGWSINIKGKLSKIDNRSKLFNIINGTFKYNNLAYNNYKYNNIPNNHFFTNKSNINKDGKYNIKVKLNFS